MFKKKGTKITALILAAMMTASAFLSGCGGKSAEKEDAETITGYLEQRSIGYKGGCRNRRRKGKR